MISEAARHAASSGAGATAAAAQIWLESAEIAKHVHAWPWGHAGARGVAPFLGLHGLRESNLIYISQHPYVCT